MEAESRLDLGRVAACLNVAIEAEVNSEEPDREQGPGGVAADAPYLREIGRIALLNPAEEAELAQVVKLGGPDLSRARARLIEANLRFVVRLARRYEGRGLELMDLIQEGNLGLISAAERFDADQGYRFSTFAAFLIRGAITGAIDRQGRTVRLPRYLVQRMRNTARAERMLRQLMGREPTADEVAECIGVPVEKLAELAFSTREAVSLDAPAGEDDGPRLESMIRQDVANGPSEKAIHLDLGRQTTEALLETKRESTVGGRRRDV
jgi:RNA polymerase primary sigma factor